MKVSFYYLFLFVFGRKNGLDLEKKEELPVIFSIYEEMLKGMIFLNPEIMSSLHKECYLLLVEKFPILKNKKLFNEFRLIDATKDDKAFKCWQKKRAMKEISDSIDREFTIPVLDEEIISKHVGEYLRNREVGFVVDSVRPGSPLN